MDVFTKLFGEFLVFVYHCFDRIVIHGYLTALSRPKLVVHFFRDVVGVAEVSKEVLSQRTNDYQRWVEAFARNHSIPIERAEKAVRKEDHVLPWLNRMARRDAYGVYFIFKSMEQGPTFRISLPRYPSKDPHYRILAHQRSRFTHYYFYIRDEVLGPMVLRAASFFPFQTTYYLNGHSFIEQELKRQQSLSRRLNANSLLRRKGAVQRLRQIMDGFSLANGLRGQPHRTRNARSIRRTSSVRARLSIPRSCSIWLDGPTSMNSGTLRMQLPRQSRDDRDHVAFVRTLVRRRTDLIGLPRHRSDYKNSERRRFAVDQTAATVIRRPAPPNQLRGRVPIRRPPSTAPDPQEIAG